MAGYGVDMWPILWPEGSMPSSGMFDGCMSGYDVVDRFFHG